VLAHDVGNNVLDRIAHLGVDAQIVATKKLTQRCRSFLELWMRREPFGFFS
jgi:hypothetical protein